MITAGTAFGGLDGHAYHELCLGRRQLVREEAKVGQEMAEGRKRHVRAFAPHQGQETVEAEASAGSELAEQWLQNFEGGSIMHRPAPTRSFGAIRCGG